MGASMSKAKATLCVFIVASLAKQNLEFAASHRLSQGSGLRGFQSRLQQGFAADEIGSKGKFARHQS
jgi:hypothetical protein